MISNLTLATEGTRSFDAYYARPSSAGTSAAVMVLSEMFGLNDPIRDVADSYARHGYAALVPNLFWRSEITRALAYEGPDREIAWARLKGLDLDAAAEDIRTALRWMRSRPSSTGKVVAVGFCGGGRLAFLAATRTDIDGAVSLYGLGIAHHLHELVHQRCPLQIHYGLQDQHIPQAEIDTVAKAVHGRPSVELFVYPDAGHSFCNSARPTYDAEAAALAGTRIEELLQQIR
jgi:carboxymethylenebutenolidase